MKTINNRILILTGLVLLFASPANILKASGFRNHKHSHTFTMSHSVNVPVNLDESFEFIIHDFSKNYNLISPAHKYFTLRGKDKIELGTLIDCAEKIENQTIVHEYVVVEIVENELIYYVSAPSKSKLELKKRTVESLSNTYVFWNFKRVSERETQIQVEVVVRFKNGFEKTMVGLSGTMKPWKKHCIEEMEDLKRLMVDHFNSKS